MFTYPGVCLRAMNIQKIPRVDCKPILVEFLQDVHSKMPSVCGHHLRFQPKLRYLMPGLYAGSEARYFQIIQHIQIRQKTADSKFKTHRQQIQDTQTTVSDYTFKTFRQYIVHITITTFKTQHIQGITTLSKHNSTFKT